MIHDTSFQNGLYFFIAKNLFSFLGHRAILYRKRGPMKKLIASIIVLSALSLTGVSFAKGKKENRVKISHSTYKAVALGALDGCVNGDHDNERKVLFCKCIAINAMAKAMSCVADKKLTYEDELMSQCINDMMPTDKEAQMCYAKAVSEEG